MASIFSKIISGEIPSFKVAESDQFYAFLDVRPVAFGHTLIVPKQEVDYIFDMEDALYLDLLLFAKKVAKVLKEEVTCKKIGISVIGLEVPHAHVHLVPINAVSDMTFGKSIEVSEDDMLRLSSKLFSKLS
jgi:histidine triad (HIT) family protein